MDKMLGEAIFDGFDPENRPDQSPENSGGDWRAGELSSPVRPGAGT